MEETTLTDNTEALVDLVRSLVANELGLPIDEVQLESSFIDDLGGDSLDQVMVAMAIEEDFGIEFPDVNWDSSIKTVSDIVRTVTTAVQLKEARGKLKGAR